MTTLPGSCGAAASGLAADLPSKALMGSSTAHRTPLFLALVLCGIAASQGIELFVNRILRPNANEITWISEAVMAGAFVAVTWLWVRLRETQVALTDLERQQIVGDAAHDCRPRPNVAAPRAARTERRYRLVRRRGTGRQSRRRLLRFRGAAR